MFYVNSNTPISNNRYFVFVTDTAGLATATASALYKRIEFEYRTLADTNAGFVGEGTTFLSLLQGASFTDVEAKLKVTDIVVMGGRRDTNKGVVANILPAMETFSNYCKQHFPLAKVWVGMTGWADVGINTSGWVNVTMQFKDILEGYALAGKYGMCYMNNIQYATHRSNFWTDTFTLNSTGCNYVGYHVAECLLNGTTTVAEAAMATETYRSGCSAIGNTSVRTSINNNIASLYIRNGSSSDIGFTVPSFMMSSYTWYPPIALCDLEGVWCTGRVNEFPYGMVSDWMPCPYSTASGSQYFEEARVLLKGRTLFVQVRDLNPNVNSGHSMSRIVIREPILITCDAMFC